MLYVNNNTNHFSNTNPSAIVQVLKDIILRCYLGNPKLLHKTLAYSSHYCSLYIKVKMEEVQLKALELLSQMNNNSQSTVRTSRSFTVNDELVHQGSLNIFFLLILMLTNCKNKIAYVTFFSVAFPFTSTSSHLSGNTCLSEFEISLWYAFILEVWLYLTNGFFISCPVWTT